MIKKVQSEQTTRGRCDYTSEISFDLSDLNEIIRVAKQRKEQFINDKIASAHYDAIITFIGRMRHPQYTTVKDLTENL